MIFGRVIILKKLDDYYDKSVVGHINETTLDYQTIKERVQKQKEHIEDIQFQLQMVTVEGQRVAAHFKSQVVDKATKKSTQYDTIAHWHLNDEGKIVEVLGVVNPPLPF